MLDLVSKRSYNTITHKLLPVLQIFLTKQQAGASYILGWAWYCGSAEKTRLNLPTESPKVALRGVLRS